MVNSNANLELYSKEKIAFTSSKGNQEKWLDGNKWYKIDQFGYEALSEVLICKLLEQSDLENSTPFKFVRYDIEEVLIHNRKRVACVSENFLHEGEDVVTIAKLLSNIGTQSLSHRLSSLRSDKRRIEFLVSSVKEITGLDEFDKYLSVLFEIDCRFLNDDRHLNNIAVIMKEDGFDYCPIFDNGAALLSNMQYAAIDINPKALIAKTKALPFNMTFNRLQNTMQSLYGQGYALPKYGMDYVLSELSPLTEFYPSQLRSSIRDRVLATIKLRQK